MEQESVNEPEFIEVSRALRLVDMVTSIIVQEL